MTTTSLLIPHYLLLTTYSSLLTVTLIDSQNLPQGGLPFIPGVPAADLRIQLRFGDNAAVLHHPLLQFAGPWPPILQAYQPAALPQQIRRILAGESVWDPR